jgi:hypothetical protein
VNSNKHEAGIFRYALSYTLRMKQYFFSRLVISVCSKAERAPRLH